MQRFLPLILFVIVAFVALNFFKREREMDATGNPIIRNWGSSILFLLITIFLIVIAVRNLSDPFHQRYPENTYVEVAGGILGLVATLLSFYFRFTLTKDRIEMRVVPFFKKSYLLSSVIKVPSYTRGRLAIELAGGGKIELLAVYSGVPYFLKGVSAQIERQKKSQ
jgi:hypothetical protein